MNIYELKQSLNEAYNEEINSKNTFHSGLIYNEYYIFDKQFDTIMESLQIQVIRENKFTEGLKKIFNKIRDIIKLLAEKVKEFARFIKQKIQEFKNKISNKSVEKALDDFDDDFYDIDDDLIDDSDVTSNDIKQDYENIKKQSVENEKKLNDQIDNLKDKLDQANKLLNQKSKEVEDNKVDVDKIKNQIEANQRRKMKLEILRKLKSEPIVYFNPYNYILYNNYTNVNYYLRNFDKYVGDEGGINRAIVDSNKSMEDHLKNGLDKIKDAYGDNYEKLFILSPSCFKGYMQSHKVDNNDIKSVIDEINKSIRYGGTGEFTSYLYDDLARRSKDSKDFFKLIKSNYNNCLSCTGEMANLTNEMTRTIQKYEQWINTYYGKIEREKSKYDDDEYDDLQIKTAERRKNRYEYNKNHQGSLNRPSDVTKEVGFVLKEFYNIIDLSKANLMIATTMQRYINKNIGFINGISLSLNINLKDQ